MPATLTDYQRDYDAMMHWSEGEHAWRFSIVRSVEVCADCGLERDTRADMRRNPQVIGYSRDHGATLTHW